MRYLVAELRRQRGSGASEAPENPKLPSLESDEEWTPENCILFEEGILTTPLMDELLACA